MLLALVPNHTDGCPHSRRDYAGLSHGGSRLRNTRPSNNEEIFGDSIPLKQMNTLRLGFQNIGGLPLIGNKHKDDIMRCGISLWDFDIFGIAETNVDWRLVKEEDRLYLRTKEWWESVHISHSFNCSGTPVTAQQYGGTALFSISNASHRVIEKGADPFNLGRWSWTR
jgi:hypothetical protein